MSATALKTEYIDTHNSSEFVTIFVADQVFGVAIKAIHDVFELDSLTPVPGARADIAGVLNIRGRIVTAIDARIKFGLAPRAEGYAGMMAVGIEHNGEVYGILVDKVGEVLRLNNSDCEPNPMNMDASWKLFSKGIFRLDGKLLMSLDIERLLA
jgi:purine-binding chemotaxis protein CheW